MKISGLVGIPVPSDFTGQVCKATGLVEVCVDRNHEQ
jgi:hypothetical protein